MKRDVAIVGAGYVGVPLAQVFADAGKTVVLVDVDAGRVAQLNRGESYIEDVPSEELAAARRRRSRRRDDRLRRAPRGRRDPRRAPDAALAAARARPPHPRSAAEEIATRLRPGHARRARVDDVPGDDARAGAPVLEAGSGLKAGTRLPPRVLAGAGRPGPRGLDDEDRAEGRRRHRRGLDRGGRGALRERDRRRAPVSSPEAAELTKLLENIFRSVNIALVNELAQLCDRMGIDVWEVVEAAATKPFGFMSFKPGPGPRRALHPDRPLLPHVEGARVRLLHRVHRARREGERVDAVLLPLARLAGAEPHAAALAQGLADPRRSASRTSRTSPTRASRPRSSSSRCSRTRAPRSPTTTRTSRRSARTALD